MKQIILKLKRKSIAAISKDFKILTKNIKMNIVFVGSYFQKMNYIPVLNIQTGLL